MLKPTQVLMGLTATAAVSLLLLPRATAQGSDFQGRGVAQGSAFTRGRSADLALTIDGGNFGLELAEPLGLRGESPRNRARVQYRGAIIREDSAAIRSGNFTLDGRIRSFTSSANLRVIGNTTGTCRIEVFDSRVISSSCRAVADDSSTQFLGLEQF